MGSTPSFVVTSSTIPGPMDGSCANILREHNFTLTPNKNLINFTLTANWAIYVHYYTGTKHSYFLDHDRIPRFRIAESIVSKKIQTQIETVYDPPFTLPVPDFYTISANGYLIIDPESKACECLRQLKSFDKSYKNYLEIYHRLTPEHRNSMISNLIYQINAIEDIQCHWQQKEFSKYKMFFGHIPYTEEDIITYCTELIKSIETNNGRDYVLQVYSDVVRFWNMVNLIVNLHKVTQWIDTNTVSYSPDDWFKRFDTWDLFWKDVKYEISHTDPDIRTNLGWEWNVATCKHDMYWVKI